MVSGNPSNTTVGELGDLDILLDWHRNDPPDDFEMNRNNIIYQWQFNRNPFIDQPDLVEYIWGDNVGEVWQNPLSTENFNENDIVVYPNPSTTSFIIDAINNYGDAAIYDQTGRLIATYNFIDQLEVEHQFPTGLYLVKITSQKGSVTKKLLVH